MPVPGCSADFGALCDRLQRISLAVAARFMTVLLVMRSGADERGIGGERSVIGARSIECPLRRQSGAFNHENRYGQFIIRRVRPKRLAAGRGPIDFTQTIIESSINLKLFVY